MDVNIISSEVANAEVKGEEVKEKKKIKMLTLMGLAFRRSCRP